MQDQRNGLIDLVYFRPLVVASYQIDYALFGDNPFAFHIVNLILHSLNTVLVFTLIRKFGLKLLPSFAGAAVFALYPSNTEAVIWISARGDLLAGFWLLTSLIFILNWAENQKNKWLVFSSIGFLLATLSKESAVAGLLLYPMIVSGYLTCDDNCLDSFKSKIKLYSPFIVIILANVLFRTWLFGDLGGARDESGQITFFNANFPDLWQTLVYHNLKILFTPVNRELWTDWPQSWKTLLLISGAFLYLTFFFGIGNSFRMSDSSDVKSKLTILGLAWIVILFLPVINLPEVLDSLVRSRYLYLPLIGLAILLSVSFEYLNEFKLPGKVIGTVCLVLILISSGFSIVQYNKLWVKSGEYASIIHESMVDSVETLTNDSTIYVLNYPWKYRGASCAPFGYGEYTRFLYGHKRVKTIPLNMSGDEIQEWWWPVLESADTPIRGFTWDWQYEEVFELPVTTDRQPD